MEDSGLRPRVMDRVSIRLVGQALERDPVVVAGLVVALLTVGFTLTWVFGGTTHVPPHWFYIPIMFAAVRFGLRGGVPAAVVAAVLAGPLTPADVAASQPQPLSDWLTRGVFFVLIGAVLPTMLKPGTVPIQEFRRRQRVEDEIRQAVLNDEFLLLYQPIIELTTGRLVGAEALLRWDHPTRGFLTPDAFIDDVERLGSVASWVVTEAATTTAGWAHRYELADEFSVSVNVSSQTLAQPDFVTVLRTSLRAAQLEPRRMCIELTETVLIDDIDMLAARLQVIRSLGTKVSIDDFGSGHSTLSYLRELPFDFLKIDRGFVQNVGEDGRADSIVKSLAELAEALEVVAVAEGVETEEHRRQLISRGIRHAQGFLFARPLPADVFEQLLLHGEMPVPDASP